MTESWYEHIRVTKTSIFTGQESQYDIKINCIGLCDYASVETRSINQDIYGVEVYAANKPGHLELKGLFTDSSSRIYAEDGLCGPRFFELYDIESQENIVPAGLAHVDNEMERLQIDCS